MRAFLLSGLLVAVAVAGCLGGDDPADDPIVTVPLDWYLHTIPHLGEDQNHDHTDPEQHRGLSTPNFQVAGWDPLVTEYHGRSSGTYYCGEITETEDRVLAAYNSFSSDVALIVVDITEPTEPHLLGELVLPLTHTYDAAITDDGRYAVLATSPLDTGPDTLGQAAADVLAGTGTAAAAGVGSDTYRLTPYWRDACGNVSTGIGEDLPLASGVVLVDLADPTTPVVADFVPQPVIGAHSVSAHDIDGVRWVIGSTTNLAHPASYFSFFTVDDTPLGGKLVPYGVVDAQYPDPEQGTGTGAPAWLLNGHVDAAIQKHPVTGQLLAYLANWNGGMLVYEVVAPGLILPVSAWTGFGSIHEATPLGQLWNDRHITLVGQEGGKPNDQQATGMVALLDTTDPTDPHAVAWWTLPFSDLQWDGSLMFSTHYVQLSNDTLYVALYHGGVWAADASPEQWPALPTIGAFVPVPPGQMEQPFSATLAPEVLDVNLMSDGSLLVIDSYAGAFTLWFDRDVPVPPSPPLDLSPPWVTA